MAPRGRTKRLRGVERAAGSGDDDRTSDDIQVVDSDRDSDGGSDGGRDDTRPSDPRPPASAASVPPGFKLSSAELESIDATIDKYMDEAKKAELALPDNVTVTGHELDAATRSTVRFVLLNNSSNEGGLLTGRDLNAHISSVIVQKKGVAAVVLAKAQHVLAKSFGLELVELEKDKQGVKSGAKYFILKSMCPSSVYVDTVGKTEAIEVLEKRGLLGFFVTLVHMAGSLPEPELWRHMESLGAEKARVTEMIEDALRRRYVKVDKSSMGMDEDVRVYAVAERALAEGMGEEAVLLNVQDVFKD